MLPIGRYWKVCAKQAKMRGETSLKTWRERDYREARGCIKKARNVLFDMLDGIRDNFICDERCGIGNTDDETEAADRFNGLVGREHSQRGPSYGYRHLGAKCQLLRKGKGMNAITAIEPVAGPCLLRAAFPLNQISKLPKPSKKQTEEVRADFKKSVRCNICGTWHHPMSFISTT